MEYQTPLSMLYHWEKTNPDKVFLKQPIDNVWHTWTWKQAASETRQLAAAILSLNFQPGSNIGLLSKNCAHWIICDLAIMMAGHVSVPIYPNLQAHTIEQILEHCEAKLLLVGKLDSWTTMKTGVPKNLKTVSLPFCDNEGCESWVDFTGSHNPLKENRDRQLNEVATIIYTSGTTGMPKGVVFHFKSFGFIPYHVIDYAGFKQNDRFFSYLPLSHIAERMLVETISLYIGGEVSFAESLQQFPQNLRESRPTIFLGVHRIWSRFQEGILAKLPQRKLDLLLRIPILSALTKKKIRKELGLSEATMILTGAAPTPVSLLKWFKTIGINIQEAYAMTENCCYSHASLSRNLKIGFVGQPLPQCEVRLSEENEIQIRHEAMMIQYYKEPQKTAEVFTVDGFLKTGDEGFIDEQGFLKITGRVKDLFKTAKGKYVAPSPIEMKLMGNLDLEHACVVGSGLPQPLVIITLSANSRKKSWGEIDAALRETINVVNTSLDSHEKLAKIIVVQDEWSVENNLLTPSFKIKRNQIEKKYESYYSQWNDGSSVVIRQTF